MQASLLLPSLIRIFNTPDDIYLGINDLEENRVKKAMDK